MSLPLITITGNVVSDPQLSFTASGVARVSFRVAANDRKKDENGNWVDGDSTFISVTAWRNIAENVAESATKGTSVVVIGRLKSRTVEDPERGKATYYDVDAETVAIDLRRGPVKTLDTPNSAPAKSFTPTDDPWTTKPALAFDEAPF